MLNIEIKDDGLQSKSAVAKNPVSRRLSQWDKGFSSGFASACAIMLSQHKEGTMVEDTFICNFMDEAAMRRRGVDEFDIQILKPIIKEIKRKQSARNV